jgi:alpha-ribazole phosphatase
MQIYLIRHPRPDCDPAVCYGQQDVPVDPAAVQMAAALVRARLAPEVLERAALWSSPARRCLSLARELAAPRAPAVDADLSEMSFGSWEGTPWDAIPRREVQAWSDDLWHYKPGGHECAAMVAERWRRWREAVLGTGVETAVAVTHAGVIRVALACTGGLSAADWPAAAIDFGGVYRLDVEACAA